VEDPIGEEDL